MVEINFYILLLYTFKGPFDWRGEKSGIIENGERMKKSKDRKDFNFSHFCLVGIGKVEEWKK